MFNFGRPEDTALLSLQELASRLTGPALADKPLDEMALSEIQEANAYLYAGIQQAVRDDLGQAETECLLLWYEEVFRALLELDEGFQRFVLSPAYIPPEGHHAKDKYLEIVASRLAELNSLES